MEIFASLTQPTAKYLFLILKGKPHIDILNFYLTSLV